MCRLLAIESCNKPFSARHGRNLPQLAFNVAWLEQMGLRGVFS
jgi:hypothetical protein